MWHHRRICSVLVVAFILTTLLGCSVTQDPQDSTPLQNTEGSENIQVNEYASIEWSMKGVWVDEEGIVQDWKGTADIALRGELPTDYDFLYNFENDLEFAFWEGVFRELDSGVYTLSGFYASKHNYQHIYTGSVFIEYPDASFTDVQFLICLEDQFVVARFGDEHLYWVASLDPDADPSELFAFYRTYVRRTQ